MSHKIVIVPAAGVGQRMNLTQPKQYMEIAGQAVLTHTLSRLAQCMDIDLIVVVISPDDTYFGYQLLPNNCVVVQSYLHSLHRRQSSCPVLVIKEGGSTRALTVLNALNYLLQNNNIKQDDWILVHDAARCCIQAALIKKLIQAVEGHEAGGLLAIPVTDTIKSVAAGKVEKTVNRVNLWRAQTPQMFGLGLLYQALSQADLEHITDEASAIEQLGYHPLIVEGAAFNIKLTTTEDIHLLSFYLEHY